VNTRTLGATGIRVSEIGFGTWAIGGDAPGTLGYGPADDEESISALAEALALGCTFFDTSNLYGWGHAEKLLARAFAGCRGGVVLATKAGYSSADGQQDFSTDAIRRSLEGSLNRLQTDYVDLLQLHNPSQHVLDGNDHLFAALDAMRHEGAIRAFGISAQSPDEALLFATRYEPACLQVNFNLGDLRAWHNGLFEVCRARDIGVIARSPLAAGFLTGQLAASDTFAASDHRRRFDAERRTRWTDAVRLLRPIFDDAPDATPAQNAIRFGLSFEAVSVVIPGMMRVADVREDLGAQALPRLQPGQLRAVEAIYERVFSGGNSVTESSE
jgi:aryl-alcohol dehydrogenase-like predicted oxidoreductase